MGKRPAGVELFEGNMGSIQWEGLAFYAKRRTASHGNRTRTDSSETDSDKAVLSQPQSIAVL